MPNVALTLTYQWFNEVWNNGSEEAIDRLFGADGIAHGLPGQPRGPEGFKGFFRSFMEQFSPVKITVNEVVKEGDLESAHCTVRATDRRTGREVEFEGFSMVKVVDGQIAEAWNTFDFLSMYQQLGHQMVAKEETPATLYEAG